MFSPIKWGLVIGPTSQAGWEDEMRLTCTKLLVCLLMVVNRKCSIMVAVIVLLLHHEGAIRPYSSSPMPN